MFLCSCGSACLWPIGPFQPCRKDPGNRQLAVFFIPEHAIFGPVSGLLTFHSTLVNNTTSFKNNHSKSRHHMQPRENCPTFWHLQEQKVRERTILWGHDAQLSTHEPMGERRATSQWLHRAVQLDGDSEERRSQVGKISQPRSR